ncbi:MAG: hypothetical protein WC504_10545 [Methylobacter sp.]|jgi:hypothetical protein
MPANDSVQFFLRLVKEKHQRLIETSEPLLKALASEDPNNKMACATAMLGAAKDLQVLCSSNDVPSWLMQAIKFVTAYTSGQWSAYDLLKNFISIKTSLENYQWVFDVNPETAFDFDLIFEHFKKESRLPELFDLIIQILEEIKLSGEIDSVIMLRSLEKVIATIKKSKDGSYFSVNSAWEFLLNFLKNYMWGELFNIPLLGTALEALEKTINETNEEMFKLHQLVQEEMSKTVENEIKVLKDKSKFPFIAYDKSGHLLENPASPRLPNATA